MELVDSANPFSEGIVFSVMPPTKKWRDIRHLSGGEKVSFSFFLFLFYAFMVLCLVIHQTLASLALVFALHHFRPNPLYVMDEIDAELDFRNVSIIAQYIKSQTRNAQFIIISLKSYMFELADRLIGIYKTHDCTHTIAINPRHFSIPVPMPRPPAGNPSTPSSASQSTPQTLHSFPPAAAAASATPSSTPSLQSPSMLPFSSSATSSTLPVPGTPATPLQKTGVSSLTSPLPQQTPL